MRSALVGQGFVGSNLAAQYKFSEVYGSANSQSMIGESFDLVVFSAARAEKWRANQNPSQDLAHINELIRIATGIKAKKFILVSTVDVYPRPDNVDENTEINEGSGSSYGNHRYLLEKAVLEKHPTAQVIRLPGLFGRGLKKNAIFDLIHSNQIEKIDSRAVFQFYDLRHLWKDILLAKKNEIRVLNICSEPMRIAEIARDLFGIELRPGTTTESPRYDVRTIHSHIWQRESPYLYQARQIQEDLNAFVATCRRT